MLYHQKFALTRSIHFNYALCVYLANKYVTSEKACVTP
jgi:hypothetical protein